MAKRKTPINKHAIYTVSYSQIHRHQLPISYSTKYSNTRHTEIGLYESLLKQTNLSFRTQKLQSHVI